MPVTCVSFALGGQSDAAYFFRHLSENRNLSEEFSFWLSRASKHSSASSYVRNQSRLRSDFRALTDPKMPGHRRLPPDANKILKHGRTRNTNLCDDDTTPTEGNIVADLDEVIETRAGANHCVSR